MTKPRRRLLNSTLALAVAIAALFATEGTAGAAVDCNWTPTCLSACPGASWCNDCWPQGEIQTICRPPEQNCGPGETYVYCDYPT